MPRVAPRPLEGPDADAIVIYREPGPDGYAGVRTAGRGETLTPLLLESVALPVADILG